MLEPQFELTLFRRDKNSKNVSLVGKILNDIGRADVRLGIAKIKDVFSFETNNVLDDTTWNNPLAKKVLAENTIQTGDMVQIKAFNGSASATETDDLLIFGQITGFNHNAGESGARMSFNGTNITENILSGFALGTYSVTDTTNTVPEIILNIINNRLNFGPVTAEKKVYAALDTQPISDPGLGISNLTGGSGNVVSTKSDGTAFKEITYAKAWQPIYRILEDLAQTSSTGDNDAGTYIFYVKPTPVLPIYIDKIGLNYINELVFKPVSQTVSQTITRGVEYSDIKVSHNNNDVVNVLIIKPGVDCNGVGLTTYAINSESVASAGPKFKFWSKPEIANTIKKEARAAGELLGSAFIGDYPHDVVNGSSWAFTTIFDRDTTTFPYIENSASPKTATGTGDEEETKKNYNDIIIDEALIKARIEGTEIVRALGEPRFTVNANLVYGNNDYQIGDLLKINDQVIGWDGTTTNPDFKLRVQDIRHRFDNTGWGTTLVLKEDEKVISERLNS